MTDNLTPRQRSYCMSQVRTKGTDLESIVRSALHRRGLRFTAHAATLPGRPDIVFPSAKVAVFIDGDFWHGYRFPLWCGTLSPFWRTKIAKNRARDQRNFRKLRRAGWTVVRLWGHEVKRDLERCVDRITAALGRGRAEVPHRTSSRAR